MGSRSRRSRRALPRASRAPPARLPGAPSNPVSSTRLRSTPTCPRPIRAPTCRSRSRPAGTDGDPTSATATTHSGSTLDMGVYEPLVPTTPSGRPSGAAGAAARSRTWRSPRTASRRRPTYEADRKALRRPVYDPGLPTGPDPGRAPGRPSSGLATARRRLRSPTGRGRDQRRCPSGPTSPTRAPPTAARSPIRPRAGTRATSTPTASRSRATRSSRPASTTRSSRSPKAARGSTGSASSTTTTTSAAARSASTSRRIPASW